MEYEKKAKLADWIAGYEKEMYYLAYALLKNIADAQDAVGAVIINVFKQEVQVENEEAFHSWIIQDLMDQVQKVPHHQQVFGKVPDGKEAVNDKVTEMSEDDKVWDTVGKLDFDDRMLILLYYFEAFSTTEISEIIKQPVSIVCARLERAKAMLKEIWIESCEESV